MLSFSQSYKTSQQLTYITFGHKCRTEFNTFEYLNLCRESKDWVKFCNHTNNIIKLFNDLMRESGDNLGGVAGNLLK